MEKLIYESLNDMRKAVKKIMTKSHVGGLISIGCPEFCLFDIHDNFDRIFIVNSKMNESFNYSKNHLKNGTYLESENQVYMSSRNLLFLLLEYASTISNDISRSKRGMTNLDAAFCHGIVLYTWGKVSIETEYIVCIWRYFLRLGIKVPKLFVITSFRDGVIDILGNLISLEGTTEENGSYIFELEMKTEAETTKVLRSFRGKKPSDIVENICTFFQYSSDRDKMEGVIVIFANTQSVQQEIRDYINSDTFRSGNRKFKILEGNEIDNSFINIVIVPDLSLLAPFYGKVIHIYDFLGTSVLRDSLYGENRFETVPISKKELLIRKMLLIPGDSLYFFRKNNEDDGSDELIDGYDCSVSAPRDSQQYDFGYDALLFAKYRLCIEDIYIGDQEHSFINKYVRFLISRGAFASKTEITSKGQFISNFRINPAISCMIWEWKLKSLPIYPIIMFAAVVSTYNGIHTLYTKHRKAVESLSSGRYAGRKQNIKVFLEEYKANVFVSDVKDSLLEDIMYRVMLIVDENRRIEIETDNIPSNLNKDLISGICRRMKILLDIYTRITGDVVQYGIFDTENFLRNLIDVYKKVSGRKLEYISTERYENPNRRGHHHIIDKHYGMIYQVSSIIYPLIFKRKKNKNMIVLFASDPDFYNRRFDIEYTL